MPSTATCTFTCDHGHELAARLDRPDGPIRATALFAHCFTCSKDLRAARRLTEALAERGFAVLSFDFTGLGQSEGEFAGSTFSADVEDLIAAAEYLDDEIAAPSLLVGHSLGGAAVLSAASRLPSVGAVAAIGAPADVSHVTNLFGDHAADVWSRGEGDVEIGGRTFTLRDSFLGDVRDHRLLNMVSDLDAAVLLLHSPTDAVVDVDNARRLYQAARHPKSFVSLHDADHLLTDVADARYAADVIATWAGRYVASGEPIIDDAYDDARVVATNTGGLVTDVTTRGFGLAVDEPAEAGGTETGPTPYEYLGTALASCTSMTIRMYADRKEFPLDEVTTTVTFDRLHAEDCADCEHTEGRIERFDRTVTLDGDLSDDQRQRLLTIANRCPVHRTLEGQIEIHTALADG